MKIHQIIQEAPFTDEQEKSFIDTMNTTDWKYQSDEIAKINPSIYKLGSGIYSTVYGSDSSENVLKIAHDDKGAIAYLSWCIRNQKNPHVPKILSMHKEKNGRYLYAKLEKLVNAYSDDLSTKNAFALLYLYTNLTRTVSTNKAAKLICVDTLNKTYGIPEEDLREFAEARSLYVERSALLEIFRKYPDVYDKIRNQWLTDPFTQVFRFIAKTRNSDKVFLDFHFEPIEKFHNIMKRASTGDLVVTDPLGGR